MDLQPEPVLTPIAEGLLRKRYLVRDDGGAVIETPRNMFERVANAVADADREWGEDPGPFAEVAYGMMARGDFLPNTPCLANAGRPGGTGQLSACFVIPIDDDMTSIMDGVKHAALIHKSGGGTGFSFSRLRPSGDFVKGTSGVASGPVSFMKMYNAMTEYVKQGGIRRGANMGILRVDHPDVSQFIDCKRLACPACARLGLAECDHEVANFNISVAATEQFMLAVKHNAMFDLVHPKTKLKVGQLNAAEVFQRIVENAHHSGEPGLFFVDRVNAMDPLSHYLGPVEATNPCGEVPLRPYDACTLGSINLGNFYVRGQDGHGSIDFARLETTVGHAVHFLDNILEVSNYPVQAIKDTTQSCRKIGLGVMGWADLLVKLEFRYDSKDAYLLAEQVMSFVNSCAVSESGRLAEQRGPFPHWEHSQWWKQGDKPRRHSTATVIAPTGSISMIAGCSSGIEPLFALAIKRHHAVLDADEVNPAFEEVARREGWYSESLMQEVAATGSVSGQQFASYVPERWRDIFRTSMDIKGDDHVRVQAAFQKHTEDAVSKTINLPRDATVADVASAYQLAWSLGCKGITVYRDGSRTAQVLSAGLAVPTLSPDIPHVGPAQLPGSPAGHGSAPLPATLAGPLRAAGQEARTLPTPTEPAAPVAAYESAPGLARPITGRRRVPSDGRRRGETLSKKTAYGTVHTTINVHPDDGEPFECFVSLGKGGSEVSAMMEALGRAVSLVLALEGPVPPRARLDLLAEQFATIGGGQSHGFGANRIVSAPDGVAHAFLEYLYGKDQRTAVPLKGLFDICPECRGATLTKGGKCDQCLVCGYSAC